MALPEKVRIEGIARVRVEPATLPLPYVELATGRCLAITEDEAVGIYVFLADAERPTYVTLASLNAVVRCRDIAALFVDDLAAVAAKAAEHTPASVVALQGAAWR